MNKHVAVAKAVAQHYYPIITNLTKTNFILFG